MASLSGFLLPQLGTLVLRHCSNSPTGARMPGPAKLTNLRKLTLESTENNTFRHIAHPKLEELELRFSRVPYKKQVSAAFKSFTPQVTTLHAL